VLSQKTDKMPRNGEWAMVNGESREITPSAGEAVRRQKSELGSFAVPLFFIINSLFI